MKKIQLPAFIIIKIFFKKTNFVIVTKTLFMFVYGWLYLQYLIESKYTKKKTSITSSFLVEIGIKTTLIVTKIKFK